MPIRIIDILEIINIQHDKRKSLPLKDFLPNKLFKGTAITAACQFIHLGLGHSRSNLSRKFLRMRLQVPFPDNLFTHHTDHKADAGINA